ncbi:MAG: M28 family peptidase [Bacteroidota bacterium]|nr:M28 family peptidase [Bacteroidota bacterium]MDP4236214.1 M28 family peptidase [Bacteroidota bacterium]
MKLSGFICAFSSLVILNTVPLSAFSQTTSPSITSADLRQRMNILASDSLAGRRTGEPGCESAARYIAKEFKRMGLRPLDPAKSYFQHYDFSERAFDSTKKEKTKAVNVIGFIPGSSKKLKDQVVIIGAHYDHLGMGGKNALDTVKAIHYGADDNASGTVGLLELAEYYSRHKASLKRSLLFISFSGEEEGLFGSLNYAKNPLIPLEKTQAMINMDMIGRLKDSILIVEGMGSSPYWKILMDSLKHENFLMRYKPDGVGPSDHSSFYRKNIPVIFYFTGLHRDYHRATDTKDKINYEGEVEVLDLVRRSIDAIQSKPDRIPFTLVPEDTTKKIGTFKVYVGGVPDYGYDGEGLKLSDITPGSPAAKAGLKTDDIIIKFADIEIKNIYDYTGALGKFKPDDVVDFRVKRGKEVLTIPVKLGKRGEAH